MQGQGRGAKPASLGRYKASIAKIHQLLNLKDPTQAELVKLRLRAIRREKGAAQAQARPLSSTNASKSSACSSARMKRRAGSRKSV